MDKILKEKLKMEQKNFKKLNKNCKKIKKIALEVYKRKKFR